MDAQQTERPGAPLTRSNSVVGITGLEVHAARQVFLALASSFLPPSLRLARLVLGRRRVSAQWSGSTEQVENRVPGQFAHSRGPPMRSRLRWGKCSEKGGVQEARGTPPPGQPASGRPDRPSLWSPQKRLYIPHGFVEKEATGRTGECGSCGEAPCPHHRSLGPHPASPRAFGACLLPGSPAQTVCAEEARGLGWGGRRGRHSARGRSRDGENAPASRQPPRALEKRGCPKTRLPAGVTAAPVVQVASATPTPPRPSGLWGWGSDSWSSPAARCVSGRGA